MEVAMKTALALETVVKRKQLPARNSEPLRDITAAAVQDEPVRTPGGLADSCS
jgi:hypothetical protein